MCDPKRIKEISLADLQAHRWCYYHNDNKGYDSFEFVIPDTHPELSESIIELELAEFTFENGKVALGVFDGSESFWIAWNKIWLSFWYGVAKPSDNDLEEMGIFLSKNNYDLPVEARAKWSGTTKIFNGVQYVGENGEIVEIAF